jgi:hypothetical protein
MNPLPFQYSVVRYVPDVVRDEPINIGVIVRDPNLFTASAKFLPADSLSRKAGSIALQLALAFEDSLKASPIHPAGSGADIHRPDWFDVARREFHGRLRLSEPAGILASDLENARDRVFVTFVAEAYKPSSGAARLPSASLSPSRMKQKLWSAFDRVNLFESGRARKHYAARGRHATWEFDVGYKNGALSVINALSIATSNPRTNLDRALLFKGMVLEVQEEAKEAVHATAIIPDAPLVAPPQSFAEARQILVDADIKTYGMVDVASLAQQVQAEIEGHFFPRTGMISTI